MITFSTFYLRSDIVNEALISTEGESVEVATPGHVVVGGEWCGAPSRALTGPLANVLLPASTPSHVRLELKPPSLCRVTVHVELSFPVVLSPPLRTYHKETDASNQSLLLAEDFSAMMV